MANNNDSNVSRREFLRRAGKEAVDTGARIVPGGQLAKKFVEGDNAKPGDFVENPRRKWWDRFVMRNQQPGNTAEDNS